MQNTYTKVYIARHEISFYLLQVEPTKSHKEVVSAYSIKPVSISSKVLDPSGRANISVAFTSERKPAVEWLYWTRSAKMYKTGKLFGCRASK